MRREFVASQFPQRAEPLPAVEEEDFLAAFVTDFQFREAVVGVVIEDMTAGIFSLGKGVDVGGARVFFPECDG